MSVQISRCLLIGVLKIYLPPLPLPPGFSTLPESTRKREEEGKEGGGREGRREGEKGGERERGREGRKGGGMRGGKKGERGGSI